MAAQTIVLDTVNPQQITIYRNNSDNATLTFIYTVSTSNQSFAQSRAVNPTLTPKQQTQVNDLWDSVFNNAKATEGI